jgi:hypothetical protein
MKTFQVGDRVKVMHLGKFYAARVTCIQQYKQVWTTILEKSGHLVMAWDAADIVKIREKKAA